MYFTARSLLLSSPFVLGQTLFNVAASFCGPLLCFWLIFSRGGPYAWNSGEVLGPICASPLACAILAPAFVPIGMTDAVSRGWFGPVPSHDDGVRCLARFLPSLRSAGVWRVGVVRHLVLGLQLSCVAILPSRPASSLPDTPWDRTSWHGRRSGSRSRTSPSCPSWCCPWRCSGSRWSQTWNASRLSSVPQTTPAL